MDAVPLRRVAGALQCPLELRCEEIPEAGRAFIRLAQRVGVFEDGLEAQVVSGLAKRDLQALRFFLRNYPLEVDQWLRGDEALAGSLSMEYRAFACLYFAADYLSQRWSEADRAVSERQPTYGSGRRQ